MLVAHVQTTKWFSKVITKIELAKVHKVYFTAIDFQTPTSKQNRHS